MWISKFQILISLIIVNAINLRKYANKNPTLNGLHDQKPAIFFIDTTNFGRDVLNVSLKERASCAIESAARLNPNHQIIILFAFLKPFILEISSKNTLMVALSKYPNIIFKRIDIKNYIRHTQLNEWFKHDPLSGSLHQVSHLSDILRLVTLWKYGGTYMDYDIISLQSIESLGTNFLALESFRFVNSGIISVGKNGPGHWFLSQCLRMIPKFYDPNDRSSIGPNMVTAILRDMCVVEIAIDMVTSKCRGMRVLPWQMFNPIYTGIKSLVYQTDFASIKLIMQIIVNSTTIHLWGSQTDHLKVTKGDNSPLDIIAANQCPGVYRKLPKIY